jgi:hypothetical protein
VVPVTLGFDAAGAALAIACKTPPPGHPGDDPLSGLLMVAISLPFAIVGAMVVARRPENSIGRLFAAVGVLYAVSSFVTGWLVYSVFTSRLPATEFAAWVAEWLVPIPLFVGPLLLLLLFPDGKPLTARWRFALAGVAVLMAGVFVATLHTGRFSDWPMLERQFGFSGAVGDFLAGLNDKLAVPALLLFVASATSLVLRLRRSRGQERLQIKWVVYAASVAAAGFVITFMGLGVVSDIVFWVGLAGSAAMPVAAGMAILRYRLYEIDRLINRTLVYALLTAILAGVYVGSVLLLQLALEGVTSDSSLAVAISTLAVAAAFRPARARIQHVVDRRFYRRRYDAAQTLDAFSARLREEVDLDSLAAELRRAVSETMEPRHVSLWLRQP